MVRIIFCRYESDGKNKRLLLEKNFNYFTLSFAFIFYVIGHFQNTLNFTVKVRLIAKFLL